MCPGVHRARRAAYVCTLWLLVPLAAHAEPPPLSELEPFIDGVVAAHLRQRVAGVQIAVVLEGQLLLLKGYGIDRVVPRHEVEPERSLFRIGSISKTFVWLALMQLAEQGKLSLTDPINDHLPPELAIPDEGFAEPIRILDLMNHTAGFEDTFESHPPTSDAELRSMSTELQRYRPHRVRKPGVSSVYSNYGACLAGALVAHSSGMDFESYAERYIFAPLGMEHTTFRESYGLGAPPGLPAPMPRSLSADRGYAVEWGAGALQQIEPIHILQDAPAGAAVSCAADMARYMNALLDPALLARRGVLGEASFAQLAAASFREAPGLHALHHGFFEYIGMRRALGYASLEHGGSVGHFQSELALFPALHLGIFASTNSDTGGALVRTLPEQILGRFFPVPQPSAAAREPEQPPRDLSEYAGQYRVMRRSYTKLEAFAYLENVFTVQATRAGLLQLTHGPESMLFAPIARDLFQRVESDARIAFIRDRYGRIARMVGSGGQGERVGPFDSAAWFYACAAAAFIAALSGVRSAFKRRGQSLAQAAWERQAARLLTLSASAWLVYFLAAAAWEFPRRAGFQPELFNQYPHPWIKFTLALGLAAAIISLAAALTLAPIWFLRSWSWMRRLGHTLSIAAFIAFAIALNHWNAIGFHYF